MPISARTALCVHHDGAVPITVQHLTEAQALMRKDQAFHMDTRGWADIGYNFLVISSPGRPVDGAILEGRGRDVVGAHCGGRNTPWIGVQVAIGGGQTPSPAALASVRWLYDSAVKAAGHPLAMVGHSDGFPTACPGPQLLAWVRAGMPVAVPQVAPKPPPVTAPRKVTMLLIKGDKKPDVAICNGLEKRHVGPGEVEDLIALTGQPIKVISQATYDRMPNYAAGK